MLDCLGIWHNLSQKIKLALVLGYSLGCTVMRNNPFRSKARGKREFELEGNSCKSTKENQSAADSG